MMGFYVKRIRNTLSLIVCWAMIAQSLAFAQSPTSSQAHPDNASGVGEVVFPSPYNPDYPFPLYMPLEVKQGMLQDLSGLEDRGAEATQSVLHAYQHKLGVYPFVAFDGQGAVKQQAFLKPYGDWVLGGDFYQGPKRHFMRRLHQRHQEALQSIENILKHARAQGRIANWGSYDSNGLFVVAANAPRVIRNDIQTYMQALYEMHELLQTILFMPTENVDPDLLLDQSNAIGVGPLVRYQDAQQEPLLKNAIERFCTTSYLYRYMRAKAVGTQPDLVNVDTFSSNYYFEEAKGTYGGQTLAQRKQAYHSDFQQVVGESLSQDILNQIQAVNTSWVMVPKFRHQNGETSYTLALVPLYVPLTQNDQGQLRIQASFRSYLSKKDEHLHWVSVQPPSLNETTRNQLRNQHHRPVFRSALGTSAIDEAFLSHVMESPISFLRMRDQYLLHRGLYQSKGFSVQEQPHPIYGAYLLGNDENRVVIEDVVPQTLCESLYRRNYTTQILLTQMDPGSAPSIENLSLKETPAIAKPWFHFWRSSDASSRMMSALEGTLPTGQSYTAEATETYVQNHASLRNRFLTLSIRPWSIYEHFYYKGQRPTTQLGPQHTMSTQLTVVDSSILDWVLPNFFTRFGRAESFRERLWQSGLGVYPQEGLEETFRPEMLAYVQSYPQDIQNRIRPYVVQNLRLGNVRDSDDHPSESLSDQMAELSSYLLRSRVMYTPNELQWMLRAYFQDVLLPLSLIEKFLTYNVLATEPNASILEHHKRFFLNAGTVQRELLHLIQQGSDSMLMRIQPGYWNDGQTEFQSLTDAASMPEGIALTRSGYVISFAEPWKQVSRDSSAVPEWSKHDQLVQQVNQMEHRLNKRVAWCRNVPKQVFESWKTTLLESLSGDELAAISNLPAESLQALTCALPGMFHAQQNLGLFLAKEHLRFSTLQDYFQTFIPRQSEDQRLLPFVSHAQSPSTTSLSTRLMNDAASTDGGTQNTWVNLRSAIDSYQELSHLYAGYRAQEGWFDQAPQAIKSIFGNGTRTTPNWSYDPQSYTAQTTLSGSVTVDLTAVESGEAFDQSCNYTGGNINGFVDPKASTELKLLCLFRRAKSVRDFLTASHASITLPQSEGTAQTFQSPFASAIQRGFLNALSESRDGNTASLTKLFQAFAKDIRQDIEGQIESTRLSDDSSTPETCQHQAFKLQTTFLPEPQASSVANAIKKSMSTSVQGMAEQTLGEYYRSVLDHACHLATHNVEDADQHPSLGTLYQAWKVLVQQVSSSEAQLSRFFGEDVLFERIGGEQDFTSSLNTLTGAYQNFLSIVDVARSTQREDEDYQNLRAELGLAYREVQFENLLRSLVAVKAALSDASDTSSLSPIATALPEDLSYARDVRTVSEVGSFDLWGAGFSYNRNTTFGKGLAIGLDILGLGDASNPGTDYITEAPGTGFFNQLGQVVDQGLCRMTLDQGGRLLPWLSTDPSPSIVEASNVDEWSWQGFRLSVWNQRHANQATKLIASDQYFCNLKYALPRQQNFRSLTSRERELIDEANAFLAELSSNRTELQEKRQSARSDLEESFFQVVLARMFIDKARTHILEPYRVALETLSDLFADLKDSVMDGEKTSLVLAQDVFKKLKDFTASSSGRKALKLYYFRQLFVSMVHDLFPSHDLRTESAVQDFKQKLIQTLGVFYGSTGQLNAAHQTYLQSQSEEGEDANIVPISSFEEGESFRHSVVAHLTQVVEETEAFLAEVGEKLILRYPLLEKKLMQRVDGEAYSTAVSVPKVYQLFFAHSAFDPYRPNDAPRAPRAVRKANGALDNAMPASSNFYDSKMDRMDQALHDFVKSYPFNPAHLFTHRLGSNGSHYGQRSFDQFFMGSRQGLLNEAIISPAGGVTNFLTVTERDTSQDVTETDDGGTEVVVTPGPPFAFEFTANEAADLSSWPTVSTPMEAEAFEQARRQLMLSSIEGIFPWLAGSSDETGTVPGYQHSLSQFVLSVVHQVNGEVEGEPKLFHQYLEAGQPWGNLTFVDFRSDSEHRSQFSAFLIQRFQEQKSDIETSLQTTLRTIYNGEFLSERSDKKADERQERTLVQFFANPSVIQMIEERFGDRFLELKSEYVPHRVYQHFRQEQSYINIMADIAQVAMGVMLASLVLSLASGVAGGAGKVFSRAMPFLRRLPKAMTFVFRHFSTFALATVGTFALFNALAGAHVMPVMILVMLLSALRMVKGALGRSLGGFAQKRVVSLQRKQLIAALMHRAMRAARLVGWDLLVGVLLLDVVGMILDWNVANYTSSAHAYYAGLFYSHMRLPRVFRGMYGLDTHKDLPLLIRDHQYMNYLYRAKVMNFSFAVFGTLLAGLVNMWSVKRFMNARSRHGRALGSMPNDLRQSLDRLSRHANKMNLKNGDIFRHLKDTDPVSYTQLLFNLYPVKNQLRAYFANHPRWQKVVKPTSISLLIADINDVRVKWIDDVEYSLEAFYRRPLNTLDQWVVGHRVQGFQIKVFPDQTLTKQLSVFENGQAGESMIHFVNKLGEKQILSAETRSALFNVIDQRRTQRLRKVMDDASVEAEAIPWVRMPGSRVILADHHVRVLGDQIRRDPELFADLMNSISVAVFKDGTSIKDMIKARVELFNIIDQSSMHAYSRVDTPTYWQLFKAEDFKEMKELLSAMNGDISRFESELKTLIVNDSELEALRLEMGRLGFDIEFTHIQSIRLRNSFAWSHADDPFLLGPYVKVRRVKRPSPMKNWQGNPLFQGESGAVQTRIQP